MRNPSETAKAHAVANAMGAQIIFCRQCGATGVDLVEVHLRGDGCRGVPPPEELARVYGPPFARFESGMFWCHPCINELFVELRHWNWANTLPADVVV